MRDVEISAAEATQAVPDAVRNAPIPNACKVGAAAGMLTHRAPPSGSGVEAVQRLRVQYPSAGLCSCDLGRYGCYAFDDHYEMHDDPEMAIIPIPTAQWMTDFS
jgi:hypothetical protein